MRLAGAPTPCSGSTRFPAWRCPRHAGKVGEYRRSKVALAMAQKATVFKADLQIADMDRNYYQKHDLTGAIERWIEVGQPDEREIRKACGRARHVVIISYGRSADLWWQQNRDRLQRLDNLTVLNLPRAGTQALAALAGRGMQLQCSIQEGLVWITAESSAVQIEPVALLRGRA